MQPCYLLTSPEKFQAMRLNGYYNMAFHFPTGVPSLDGVRKIAALLSPLATGQISQLGDISPLKDDHVSVPSNMARRLENGLSGVSATDFPTSSGTTLTLSKLYW